MCLQYKPTVVACFCIHLACKWSNWEIPQSNEGKDWFWYVDKTVSLDQLEQLTSEFLVIFDKCPTKLKHKIKSISATQNTSLPQSISASPFDMEPRKIRPPDGSSSNLLMDGQGPSFRPHSLSESKPGPPAAEDPYKKQQPNNQPAQRVDYREYREKKERERQEREKLSQASGNRDGHHHHHHHHHHGQQPPHKPGMSNKVIPPAPQGQHHKPPNSAVTASRDAARREQAHARDMNRKRSEFTFGPLVRHEPPVDGQPLVSLDAPIANHVTNSVGKKDGQDWDIESTDSLARHGTPSEKFRDKETIARHSQSVDPSKRSGPNFDGSVKHSSKVSDNRSSANSSVVSSDNRVIKESAPRGTENAVNLPKTDSELPVQKHLYNHNRHKTSEGQELPKRPPPPGHDVSSKRVATPPPSSIRPSKSEHRVDHTTSLKRAEEEVVAASNGKPLSLHLSHHSKSKDNKSPSLQQLQHRARSPALSTLATVPVPRSKSPLPAIPGVADVRSKSPSVAPSSNKTSSQSQYFTPGQAAKSSDPVSARNGALHNATVEEKPRPPPVEKPASPPKPVEAEIPLSPPLSLRISQKVSTTPEKGGHSLRERESPYPQRQKRQRTPPSGKKQSLPPPPPPTVPAPEMPAPVSPSSGIMSPFGSPPPPTPTTPGKVLPSGGTPVSSRISTRNRTSSSSSEPELVPLVTKLDQMAGYENIIRDSRISIKLPGPVPDIIQPIRDRKAEEGAAVSGTKAQGLHVSKELKPPELIPPFSLAQPVDMGAVAFPSPAAGNVTEPDATDCTNVIDVISVTDPVHSPEKAVPDVPKTVPSIPTMNVDGKKSSSDHHHKSEKKKKKDKHKHKDKDKNREDRKKSKHKNKDKDRHKDRPETSSLASTSAPIKITIPKDKLVSLPPAPEPPSNTSNSGLKLKIQKDRLKGTESTGSSPQAMKLEPPLKIKIVKEKVEMATTNPPAPPSTPVKESRKRERSSPKSGVEHQASSQPPAKSARLSESQNRRSTSSYNKQNGVESRSSSGSGRGQSQPFTAGTKMVAKLADSHKGKPPTTGNQQ